MLCHTVGHWCHVHGSGKDPCVIWVPVGREKNVEDQHLMLEKWTPRGTYIFSTGENLTTWPHLMTGGWEVCSAETLFTKEEGGVGFGGQLPISLKVIATHRVALTPPHNLLHLPHQITFKKQIVKVKNCIYMKRLKGIPLGPLLTKPTCL